MNKPEELKKLAELINALTDQDFNTPNIPSSSDDEWDEDYDPYSYMRHNEKTADIDELCNICLIEKGGYPDFDSMRELKKMCPRVINIKRGDGDSFGWLTGVIVIDNDKAIVYG